MPEVERSKFLVHTDRVTGKPWLEVFVVSAYLQDPTDIDLSAVFNTVHYGQLVRPPVEGQAGLQALLAAVVKESGKKIDVLTLVGHAAPGRFVIGYTGAETPLELTNANFADVRELIPRRPETDRTTVAVANDVFAEDAEIRFIGCRLAMHPTWAGADEQEDGELLLRRIANQLGRRIVGSASALNASAFDEFGLQNNAADPLVRFEPDGSDGSWLIRTHRKDPPIAAQTK